MTYCLYYVILGLFVILYPTYNVDQSYRRGNILDTTLWLGQYHDIALWYS